MLPRLSVLGSVCLPLCLFVSDQDYAKTKFANGFHATLQALLSWEESFKLWELIPTENGRMAAILNLRYHIHAAYFLVEIR